MVNKTSQPTGNLTVQGNDNIQVQGSHNTITFGQRITNFFQVDSEQQTAWRNRQSMLRLVYNTWVEGVLKKSLYSEVRLELGLETQPEAVDHPWDTIVQMPDKEPRPLPREKTMLEVFQEASNSLLILGEPGSGKTTMLLELAMQAIEYAKEDPTFPIPVVFNLSSWTPRQTIAEWLVGELKYKYYIPTKIGNKWVDQDELMLLLDGLDELKLESREECVQAINSFLEDHTNYMAVCCREQEYKVLSVRQKLQKLRNAILIQPLSEEKFEGYLFEVGLGLMEPYQVLQRYGQLEGFFQTPLALSILVLTYRNASPEDIASLSKAGDQRKHLLNVYIQHMLGRRRPDNRYDTDQIEHWLVYLASQLRRRGQSIFYIENMESEWILSVGFENWFFRLIGWLNYKFFGSGSSKPTDRLNWSLKGAKKGLIFGLFYGLVLGLTSLLVSVLIGGPTILRNIELIFVLGLEMTVGLMFGLTIGMVNGLKGFNIEDRGKPGQGIRDSLRNAVFVGLIFMLIVGVFVELFGVFLAVQIYDLIGLMIMPGLTAGMVIGVKYGLICGLIGGLIGGLKFGGSFLFTHYLIRWRLYRANLIPWNLVAFLNYCTDRILLRKVGGGYIFIHRMLMEHFAEMDITQLEAKE